MKIRIACLAGAVALVAAAQAHAQKQGEIDARCEKLLPAADVATAAKAKDVKLVPYDPMKGAGGHCNYAAAEGLLVLLTINPSAGAKGFEREKARKHYAKNQKPVAGLGDEAFTADTHGNILVMRKGSAVYTLSSFLDPKSGDPLLNGERLAAIAKKIR